MSIENIFPNKQQFDTINERLLEIANNVAGGSSKLDKPANPSAESAVTMLADGTVGTKLLSEIGGGGKLYLHHLSVIENEVLSSNLSFYALSSYNGAITKSNILSLNISRFAVVNSGVLVVDADLYDVGGVYIDGNNLVCEYYQHNNEIANEEFRFNINGSTTTITDTYIEI